MAAQPANLRVVNGGPATAGLTVHPSPAPSFNEAPCSVNVRVSYRAYDLQLTLRGETGADVLTRLGHALDYLEAHGATPAAARPSAPSVDPNAPVCPVHHRPMKTGKGGGFYCSSKVAEDGGDGRPVYCRQRVSGGAK